LKALFAPRRGDNDLVARRAGPPGGADGFLVGAGQGRCSGRSAFACAQAGAQYPAAAMSKATR